MGDFPAGGGLGGECAAEIGKAAWGGDAYPPAMSAIVEEDGSHGGFAWIETGDGLVVFDQQGAGLEEFCGIGNVAGLGPS